MGLKRRIISPWGEGFFGGSLGSSPDAFELLRIKALHAATDGKMAKQEEAVEKFVCPCGKEFQRQPTYQRHMDVAHSNTESHKCRVCGKTFGNLNTLTMHMSVHSDKELSNVEALSPTEHSATTDSDDCASDGNVAARLPIKQQNGLKRRPDVMVFHNKNGICLSKNKNGQANPNLDLSKFAALDATFKDREDFLNHLTQSVINENKVNNQLLNSNFVKSTKDISNDKSSVANCNSTDRVGESHANGYSSDSEAYGSPEMDLAELSSSDISRFLQESPDDDPEKPSVRKSTRLQGKIPGWKSFLEDGDLLAYEEGEKPLAKRKRPLKSKEEEELEEGLIPLDVIVEQCVTDIATSGLDDVDTLEQHIKKIRPKLDGFCCGVCGKSFTSEKYLSMHSALHNVEHPAEMLISESYKEQDDEEVTRKAGQNGTSWTCKICRKTFAQNSNFKNHMRTHSDERPFVCDICCIGFKERYHLKKHQLFKHSSELKEECRICGKKFKDSTAVRAHERIHSDLRPYGCRRCGKSFKTSECLWHHENRSKTCGQMVGPLPPMPKMRKGRTPAKRGRVQEIAQAPVLPVIVQSDSNPLGTESPRLVPSPVTASVINPQKVIVKQEPQMDSEEFTALAEDTESSCITEKLKCFVSENDLNFLNTAQQCTILSPIVSEVKQEQNFFSLKCVSPEEGLIIQNLAAQIQTSLDMAGKTHQANFTRTTVASQQVNGIDIKDAVASSKVFMTSCSEQRNGELPKVQITTHDTRLLNGHVSPSVSSEGSELMESLSPNKLEDTSSLSINPEEKSILPVMLDPQRVSPLPSDEDILMPDDIPDKDTIPLIITETSDKSRKYICRKCGKRFASMSAFDKHMLTHTESRPYKCNMCDIGFKLKVHLKKHNLYRHSDEYPCQCRICGKKFKDSSAVRLHEKIHSDNRPFTCECGKSFKTRENLWGHRHRGPCERLKTVYSENGNFRQQDRYSVNASAGTGDNYASAHASIANNQIIAQAMVSNSKIMAQAMIHNNGEVTASATIAGGDVLAEASVSGDGVAHASVVNKQSTACASAETNPNSTKENSMPSPSTSQTQSFTPSSPPKITKQPAEIPHVKVPESATKPESSIKFVDVTASANNTHSVMSLPPFETFAPTLRQHIIGHPNDKTTGRPLTIAERCPTIQNLLQRKPGMTKLPGIQQIFQNSQVKLPPSQSPVPNTLSLPFSTSQSQFVQYSLPSPVSPGASQPLLTSANPMLSSREQFMRTPPPYPKSGRDFPSSPYSLSVGLPQGNARSPASSEYSQPPRPPSGKSEASIPIIYWDDESEKERVTNASSSSTGWQSEPETLFHEISNSSFNQL